MADLSKKERKEATFAKTQRLFTEHSQFLLVDMDNVTAKQLQTMKSQWRHNTEILLGKNTVIKKALLAIIETNNKLNEILDLLKKNVAFIFSTGNLNELKQIMNTNSRDTYASVGQVSQKDVWVNKCITTMGPEKTKFFQALDIFTKITKGKVEITNDVLVLKEGDKVGPSQANLLSLMDIKAFTFFMKIVRVIEDGVIYEPWVVDVTEEDVQQAFAEVGMAVTATSLAVGVSSKLTVPYELKGAYKKALAIAHALDISL